MLQAKSKPKIYIVVGPTASGKSDYAVELAKKINGEIVSADSRQVYKYLNIGSGKITKKEMQGIKHYGLDLTKPQKWSKKYPRSETNFSVNDYLKFAEKAIRKILKKGKVPIIAGGTGLYIDAILYGLPKNSPVNSNLRKKLATENPEQLLARIEKLNQEKYLELINNPDPSERHNARRLIRIIEILENKQKHKKDMAITPLSKELKYQPEVIFLERSEEELKERIATRLDKRLTAKGKDNLLNEVIYLRDKLKITDNWLISLGLEYKYVTLYLQGSISFAEMKESIKNKSWQYARRQMLWNKKYKNLSEEKTETNS